MHVTVHCTYALVKGTQVACVPMKLNNITDKPAMAAAIMMADCLGYSVGC